MCSTPLKLSEPNLYESNFEFETGKDLSVSFVESAVSDCQTYSFWHHTVYWSAAKTYCDCTGSLVVMDTQEKHDHLMTQIGGLYVSIEAHLHREKSFDMKCAAITNWQELTRKIHPLARGPFP